MLQRIETPGVLNPVHRLRWRTFPESLTLHGNRERGVFGMIGFGKGRSLRRVGTASDCTGIWKPRDGRKCASPCDGYRTRSSAAGWKCCRRCDRGGGHRGSCDARNVRPWRRSLCNRALPATRETLSFLGSGISPRGSTIAEMRAAGSKGNMPFRGPLAVGVPGMVDAVLHDVEPVRNAFIRRSRRARNGLRRTRAPSFDGVCRIHH